MLKTRECFENRGHVCKSKGGIIIFAKQVGNVLKQRKKGHHKFWPMKIENI